ncbi:hypothetical protein J5U46_22310 [Micromonospora tulbaghiae]|uniref:DUF4367 domain-containing protein n=1 Tax=Micromonospora tulbaghiae TaxID=479978 RepID=A0AAW4JP15_9ACTN|nr:hypothetical protein [Micromonospora tulbaghiae]MBO4142885.1 hypothetical protein [Micromonospora tulbaghiae]MDX5457967.1 hypothetical protein [Micromonospora tulbaghiae]SCE84796.1 hypothetical protein GA0070562_3385 [Micromonospora tulbaghiae]
MNEINLLRTHGPDAPEASTETLRLARDRLAAEFTAAPARRTVPPLRRRTLLVAAGAAVVAGAGVGLAVRPLDRPVEPLTLVAATIPEFPLTLRSRPATLSPPRYSYAPGQFLAVYLSRSATDDVYLSVWDSRPARIAKTSRPVAVAGRPAEIYEEPNPGGPRRLAMSWERRPGQWVSLTGHGMFADDAALLRLAEHVVDEPQQVPLRVRLAPRGWRVDMFKDDTILTLRGDSPDETLTVQVVPHRDPDLLRNVMGAREERRVTVGGREAHLIRADKIWFLQTEVPGGAVVNLQLPLRLSVDQVVAIAEQISVTPRRP